MQCVDRLAILTRAKRQLKGNPRQCQTAKFYSALQRFRVIRQTWKSADGREHTRETVVHPGSVTILPLVGDEHVCLIRNYRPAVGETLIELPAGTLEVDEDPAKAAARELQEETGYRADRIEHLHTFFLSPGIMNECMRLYVATGLKPGEQALESGEQIENLLVSWEEALAMVGDGRIHDAKTLIGLLSYHCFRRERGKT